LKSDLLDNRVAMTNLPNSLASLIRPTAKLLLTLAMTSSFLFPNASYADKWVSSELEYALLPEHCKVQLSSRPWRQREAFEWKISKAQADYWQKRIGPDFVHMHHYCLGLQWLMLAESPTLRRKRANRSAKWAYGQAIAEIAYVIKQSRPTYPLWIEINIAQAQARAGLKQYDEAVAQLANLQQQAPKRPEIYVELAKVLKKAGKVPDAIDVLEKGLDNASKKGPLLFYLAHYYYDLGNTERSAQFMARAEAEGMKMDSLRRRLGPSEKSTASKAPAM
jgi:tetratricopeptide (TPR) repeat protein